VTTRNQSGIFLTFQITGNGSNNCLIRSILVSSLEGGVVAVDLKSLGTSTLATVRASTLATARASGIREDPCTDGMLQVSMETVLGGVVTYPDIPAAC